MKRRGPVNGVASREARRVLTRSHAGPRSARTTRSTRMSRSRRRSSRRFSSQRTHLVPTPASPLDLVGEADHLRTRRGDDDAAQLRRRRVAQHGTPAKPDEHRRALQPVPGHRVAVRRLQDGPLGVHTAPQPDPATSGDLRLHLVVGVAGPDGVLGGESAELTVGHDAESGVHGTTFDRPRQARKERPTSVDSPPPDSAVQVLAQHQR